MRYYLRVCAISLLLLVGISSCDPAHATPAGYFQSEAGQTLDQFVMASRKGIMAFSRENRSREVCGMIQERGGIYSVQLVPGGAYSCEMPVVPDFSGHTVHTHPFDAAPGFSAADFASGPGYLIWRGNVSHQSGEKSVRRVR